MMMVIFRQSLEEDILGLFKELRVQAFTESPKVFGVGEAGHAFASFDWPGHNCMIFSALPDEQAEQVAVALKAFRDHLEQRQGARIPIRVFLLPCEQVV
jgi:hypothetical protein